jgi:hypothetical protein
VTVAGPVDGLYGLKTHPQLRCGYFTEISPKSRARFIRADSRSHACMNIGLLFLDLECQAR